MDRRFLRGALIGGALGAVLVSKWEVLQKNCPFLAELKGHMLFDEMGQPSRRKGYEAAEKPRTRLMARRNKIK